MRLWCFCLCVVLSFGFAQVGHSLIDNFDDGNDDGWDQIQGDWGVDDREYAQGDVDWTTTATHETYHRSYFGDRRLTLTRKVLWRQGRLHIPQ
jgi:hypothetical protein